MRPTPTPPAAPATKESTIADPQHRPGIGGIVASMPDHKAGTSRQQAQQQHVHHYRPRTRRAFGCRPRMTLATSIAMPVATNTTPPQAVPGLHY
ncbi:hypothetical protein QT383_04620 [Stenotrophomonas rhizophila]